MAKQQILFAKDDNNHSINASYKLKLPKILSDVNTFEMQFGMKQPSQYRCRHGEPESKGTESRSVPGFTDNVRI